MQTRDRSLSTSAKRGTTGSSSASREQRLKPYNVTLGFLHVGVRATGSLFSTEDTGSGRKSARWLFPAIRCTKGSGCLQERRSSRKQSIISMNVAELAPTEHAAKTKICCANSSPRLYSSCSLQVRGAGGRDCRQRAVLRQRKRDESSKAE